jgi:hypothetical protein
LAGGVAIASGLNATWVSTMDKYRITMGLELSLALVASQGMMHLMDHRLCQWEKQLIKREIGAEMVCVYEISEKSKNIFVHILSSEGRAQSVLEKLKIDEILCFQGSENIECGVTMPCSLVNAFQRNLLPLSSDLKDGGRRFLWSSVNHLCDYTIS